MQKEAAFMGTFAAPRRVDQLLEYGQSAALLQGMDVTNLVFVDPNQNGTELTVSVGGRISECYLGDPELEQADLEYTLAAGYIEEVDAYDLVVCESQAKRSYLRWLLSPTPFVKEAYCRTYFCKAHADHALAEASMHNSPLCRQDSYVRQRKAYRPTIDGKKLLASGDAHKLNYLTADYDLDELVQLLIAVATNHTGVLFKDGHGKQRLVIAPRYADDVRVVSNQFVGSGALAPAHRCAARLKRYLANLSVDNPSTQF